MYRVGLTHSGKVVEEYEVIKETPKHYRIKPKGFTHNFLIRKDSLYQVVYGMSTFGFDKQKCVDVMRQAYELKIKSGDIRHKYGAPLKEIEYAKKVWRIRLEELKEVYR